MQIGQVLWLGGFNKKKNNYNRFGFIVDANNKQEVYFHINNVNRNSEIYQYYLDYEEFEDSEEFKSQYVFFEYKLDKEKKQAVNVQLCRELDWLKFDTTMMVNLLKQIKSQPLVNQIIRKYDSIALEKEEIFNCLDLTNKFELYINALNNGNNKEEIEKRIVELFEQGYSFEVDLTPYYDILPIEIREEGNYLKFLDPVKVCNMMWERENHGLDYWEKYSAETKIKYIYRISYTYNDRTSLLNAVSKETLDKLLLGESNKLIQGFLYMLAAKYREYYPHFETGHNIIQNYVLEEITANKMINLYNINPKCLKDKKRHPKVELCEGKLWKKNSRIELYFGKFPNDAERNSLKQNGFMWDPEERVWYSEDNAQNRNFIQGFTGEEYKEKYATFCPRTRSECDISLLGNRFAYSRTSNIKKTWQYWNLQDFIEDIRIEPKVDGLSNSKEYVYRLNGWINKCVDITERIKCRKCKEVMVSNFEYSKKLTATYSCTLVSCSQYDGDKTKHDGEVYLNHCNGCGNILDNRDSPIKQEDTGYYLCIHCGRGKENHPTFKEGDKCPSCGELNMNRISSRLYQCGKCLHIIKTPIK